MTERRVATRGAAKLVSDSPASSSSPKNQQFSRLNGFRRERTLVDIYLVSGVRLRGRIKSFDQYSMILDVGQGETFLYHHAVSSIGPVQGRPGHMGRKGPGAAAGGHRGGGAGYGRRDHAESPAGMPPRHEPRSPANFSPAADEGTDAPAYPRRPAGPRPAPEVTVVRRVSRKITLPPKGEPPTGS